MNNASSNHQGEGSGAVELMKYKILVLVVLAALVLGQLGASFSADRTKDAKQTQRAQTAKLKEAERLDLGRDRKTKAKPLPGDRTVFRYTTKERAKKERRDGISRGSHMTSTGGPGRPLSATKAKQRYGLRQKPEVRETVRLHRGQKVRRNRTLGGAPGVGEVTSPKRVPVEKVVPLR